jgi:hypothetical protein
VNHKNKDYSCLKFIFFHLLSFSIPIFFLFPSFLPLFLLCFTPSFEALTECYFPDPLLFPITNSSTPNTPFCHFLHSLLLPSLSFNFNLNFKFLFHGNNIFYPSIQNVNEETTTSTNKLHHNCTCVIKASNKCTLQQLTTNT